MGLLVVVGFLVLSSWMLAALVRRLRYRHARSGVWAASGLLVACGIGLGIWCAFYCEYHLGTRYRIGGFPIPIVFFHLEDGRWVDFPVPEFQAWVTALANVVSVTAFATLPVWLISWWKLGHELEMRRAA